MFLPVAVINKISFNLLFPAFIANMSKYVRSGPIDQIEIRFLCFHILCGKKKKKNRMENIYTCKEHKSTVFMWIDWQIEIQIAKLSVTHKTRQLIYF